MKKIILEGTLFGTLVTVGVVHLIKEKRKQKRLQKEIDSLKKNNTKKLDEILEAVTKKNKSKQSKQSN